MQEESLVVVRGSQHPVKVPLISAHTLVLGSGAAGLNVAVQLHSNGVKDLLILTEGLEMGTSINTGSDKQTYYKLGICGSEPDSPEAVAEALYSGGCMHGDLALVEASLSTRAFMNLVNLGVPFPRDKFGQFVGYKTDNDPRQRATSIGPYTSREMCHCLIREVGRLGIPVRENRLAAALLTYGENDQERAAGLIVLNCDKDNSARPPCFEVYAAENIVFAVGGPGGLYRASVYPKVHAGAIGLGLMAGAKARNLPEFQYGLSSTKFRWNVSGSYMQVMPRLFSVDKDGCSDEKEFLGDYFNSAGDASSAVFLKGYQWPFDSQKVAGGSSLVDVLVYIETVVKGRRVFLDFCRNPEGFTFDRISREAKEYLSKSNALKETPIERLRAMNPDAVQLYKDNDIDISEEPLEIAVCAQHNNGGLAGNIWWESLNIKHLFPIGEVSGTHGVHRPGGSALNSGQVGGFRAAEYIVNRYRDWTVNMALLRKTAVNQISKLLEWLDRSKTAASDWKSERDEFQLRMTSAGAHIRSVESLKEAVSEAWQQWTRVKSRGCNFKNSTELYEALNTRQLCFAHVIYLEAMLFAVRSGVGSRGSCMVLDSKGILAHSNFGKDWRISAENTRFQDKILKTCITREGSVRNYWVDRRPIPKTDAWFETVWAAYKKGDIYNTVRFEA